MAEVTLIIPTLAEEKRRASLFRAIESAAHGNSSAIKIAVIVNGSRYCTNVIADLKNIRNVDVHFNTVPSAPLACLTGVQLTETPYYCFLDDDDEYLPKAIDMRLEFLERDSKIDLVVTNGYRCINGVDQECITNLKAICDDPLLYSVTNNWLASCGALYRRTTIGSDFFEDPLPYIEWTWLAYKIALQKKNIAVLDEPTFRINDTEHSASKSSAYSFCFDELYGRMLSASPPAHVAKAVRYKICNMLHCQAEAHWANNEKYQAWIKHLKSIFYPGGYRYLTFTRKLLY